MNACTPNVGSGPKVGDPPRGRVSTGELALRAVTNHLVERDPVITSSRGPKFVDHMTCPMCGTEGEGIEYHGELRDGTKVHTIAAHTAGARCSLSRQPRCLGAGMRVVFDGGVWKGLQP